MQLHRIGIAIAHLRDFLSLADVLALFHQQRVVVRIDAQVVGVVTNHHQLAEAAYARTAEDHAARRARMHRLAQLAGDRNALVGTVVEISNHLAGGGPTPIHFAGRERGFRFDFGFGVRLGVWLSVRRRIRLRRQRRLRHARIGFITVRHALRQRLRFQVGISAGRTAALKPARFNTAGR